MIPPADRRPARWLLLASLGLNLFLVGTLVPGWFQQPPPAGLPAPGVVRLPPPGPVATIHHVAEVLSPEDAAVLRERFGAEAAAPMGIPPSMAADIEAIKAALRREPFDEAAFRAALSDAAAARTLFEQRQQEALASAVARLSPEGRRRMADWQAPIGLQLRLPGEGPTPMLPRTAP